MGLQRGWIGKGIDRILGAGNKSGDVVELAKSPAETIREMEEIVDDALDRFAEIDKTDSANKKKQPKEERETPQMAELSSSKSDLYAEYNIEPFNPDDLVQKKGIKIYHQMRTDDQVTAAMKIKKLARLSTPWKITPYTKDQKDYDIADFVRSVLTSVGGTIEQDLFEILTAMDFGYSISEIIWEYIEKGKYKGKIGIKSIKTRKPDNFNFKTDIHDNLISIRQETGSVALEFDPKKFVVYSYMKEFDNYYGTSDLRAAYRAWWSKDVIIKFWNIWLERYPSPVILGFYPPGTVKTERDKLLQILKRIQIATAAVLPDNFEVDMKQNQATGHEVFNEAISFHNRAIARAILYPNLLGLADAQAAGSYALGKNQYGMFVIVINSLGRDLEETVMNEQLIKRLVDYNFDVEGYPSFSFEDINDDTTETRANILMMLANSRVVDPSAAWVRSYLNLPADDTFGMVKPEDFEKGEGILNAPGVPGGRPPKEDFLPPAERQKLASGGTATPLDQSQKNIAQKPPIITKVKRRKSTEE